MAYSCCFSLGGNLDFSEFLKKKLYEINYRCILSHFAKKEKILLILSRGRCLEAGSSCLAIILTVHIYYFYCAVSFVSLSSKLSTISLSFFCTGWSSASLLPGRRIVESTPFAGMHTSVIILFPKLDGQWQFFCSIVLLFLESFSSIFIITHLVHSPAAINYEHF